MRKQHIYTKGPYKRKKTTEERFLAKVRKTESCWEWTAALNQAGYGQMTVNMKCTVAYRIAWELFRGPIPEGMHVLHKCDRTTCVNPDHLFLGTHQDNMRDRDEKGRCYGKNSKVTADEVREIRILARTTTLYQREIGEFYGIGPATVNSILSGKNWGWIT